jgi:hypothetical protein
LRNARVATFALPSATRYKSEKKPVVSGAAARKAFCLRRVDSLGA